MHEQLYFTRTFLLEYQPTTISSYTKNQSHSCTMLTVLEVLSKYYGMTSFGTIFDAQLKIMDAQLPTFLNPMTQVCQSVKIPYEAPGHPDIPSLDEIDKAMVDNRLTQRGGAYDVCRVRNSVIKCGRDEAVFQVSSTITKVSLMYSFKLTA
jgi:hypothetical protein